VLSGAAAQWMKEVQAEWARLGRSFPEGTVVHKAARKLTPLALASLRGMATMLQDADPRKRGAALVLNAGLKAATVKVK
jgi:hypothetical protein